MGLKDDLDTYVEDVFRTVWTTRNGQKVPEPADLELKNEAVELEATVLYADLGKSTRMVKTHTQQFSAEIYKTFLYCAARVIRSTNGTITAYDGDRIMAVFIGDSKNSDAAKAALRINYAVEKIIQPGIKSMYTHSDFALEHRVGIDTSDLFIARTGIRGSNDLVWVGNAANNAAKMAALPTSYASYITADVYERLNDGSKYGSDPRQNMWTGLGSADLGYTIYGSNWHWGF